VNPTAVLTVTMLGVAACVRAIATPVVSQSELQPGDAFECVLQQFEQLGFARTMYDKSDFRTSAKKPNPNISYSDLQFRGAWDRLEVQAKPDPNGARLKITPSTFAEYYGHTGPRYSQLSTSDGATQAANAIQRACSTAAASAR
jgi:hypothetical protein